VVTIVFLCLIGASLSGILSYGGFEEGDREMGWHFLVVAFLLTIAMTISMIAVRYSYTGVIWGA